MSDPTWLHLALVPILLLASAFDLAQRRIPNRLLALALLAALPLHLASGAPASVLTMGLAGLGVGLLMFLPLYLLGGMAAGDVKLMATVGAFVGPALVFQASLATYCAGGLLALVIVLARRRGREALANTSALLRPLLSRKPGAPGTPRPPAASVGGMPYAVAITAGTLFVLWLQQR